MAKAVLRRTHREASFSYLVPAQHMEKLAKSPAWTESISRKSVIQERYMLCEKNVNASQTEKSFVRETLQPKQNKNKKTVFFWKCLQIEDFLFLIYFLFKKFFYPVSFLKGHVLTISWAKYAKHCVNTCIH